MPRKGLYDVIFGRIGAMECFDFSFRFSSVWFRRRCMALRGFVLDPLSSCQRRPFVARVARSDQHGPMFNLPLLPDAVLRGAVLSGIGLMWVILLVRVVGTRTLSKMTAFDFLVTLASASLLATAAVSTKWSQFAQAVTAITTLISAQWALAALRRRSEAVKHFIENEPLLLVRDGHFLDKAMHKARVSRGDIFAKLRGADIAGLAKVSAIVLETTGDISIVTADGVTTALMKGVRNHIE